MKSVPDRLTRLLGKQGMSASASSRTRQMRQVNAELPRVYLSVGVQHLKHVFCCAGQVLIRHTPTGFYVCLKTLMGSSEY